MSSGPPKRSARWCRAVLLLPLAAACTAPRTTRVLDLVEQHYLRDVPREALETQALVAFLGGLDPYSTYLDEAALARFDQELDGEFGGIGLFVDTETPDKVPAVRAFLAGSAAMAAGVRRGDQLLSIDGHALTGLEYEALRPLMVGPPGSALELVVRHVDGGVETLRFTRRKVQLASVRGLAVNAQGEPVYTPDANGIGYVRLMRFDRTTPDELARALAALSAARLRGLVLDLRDSNGGLLSAAVAAADAFLDGGRIVSVVTRSGVTVHDATPGTLTDVPVVMLINAGTASSSEIFAGALADHHRAAVMGRRTFGKGRVQEVLRLGEGLGAIKLSTGTFQRPSGTTIDKHDVAPGVEAGISPDPGLAIEADAAQAEAWSAQVLEQDVLLVPVPGEVPEQPVDPELARAVQELERMLK